jgi:hypothetical protein
MNCSLSSYDGSTRHYNPHLVGSSNQNGFQVGLSVNFK